ncbi:hypothetical protein TRFO_11660 [Tritrichomonas foetus]|uniref:Myb-like DNA-binding domain containing protein n=1 Tax=Tritrichomonas foetus TaxID=1144522 RepID=A0A1J4J2Q3_9EUKA|nr:hypothetical protein TRFO_11660 [Tritrichomonas foetus]|eukprot:OHS93658.1 hypothetical protein TRFO_11660 [Tritrichomonas foetus]
MPRNFGCLGPNDVFDDIECALPQELQRPKQTRQKFTQDEDLLIVELVGDNQFPNWAEIATNIPGKTGRQCRERYQHYLAPKITREPFTEEEDEIIVEFYKKYGPNWALIAEQFHGRRTNNHIKNRWNNHLRMKFNEISISPEFKQNNCSCNHTITSNTNNNNNSNFLVNNHYSCMNNNMVNQNINRNLNFGHPISMIVPPNPNPGMTNIFPNVGIVQPQVFNPMIQIPPQKVTITNFRKLPPIQFNYSHLSSVKNTEIRTPSFIKAPAISPAYSGGTGETFAVTETSPSDSSRTDSSWDTSTDSGDNDGGWDGVTELGLDGDFGWLDTLAEFGYNAADGEEFESLEFSL